MSKAAKGKAGPQTANFNRNAEKNQPREVEPPIELENQFIMRLPEEPSKELREAIRSGSATLKDRLSIKFENDMRHATVFFDNWVFKGKLVDIPTVVETLKTIDKKAFYKTADVCQVLMCKYEDDPTLTDDEQPSKVKKKDPNKVDKKYLWPHGITPPLKNARKCRFRKTLKKKYTDAPEIEKEVKRLLRVDNDAVKIQWELINEDEEKLKDPDGKDGDSITPKDSMSFDFNNAQNSTDVAEHDIFGGAVTDSEDDETKINIMEEDNSRYSGDESALSDSNVISGALKEKRPLVTEFSHDMFRAQPYPSTSDFGIGMKDEDVYAREEYQYETPSKEELQSRLEKLRHDLVELRDRRREQEAEIANIENLTLQQRFQSSLDSLISEQLEKERECQALMLMLQ